MFYKYFNLFYLYFRRDDIRLHSIRRRGERTFLRSTFVPSFTCTYLINYVCFSVGIIIIISYDFILFYGYTLFMMLYIRLHNTLTHYNFIL